ncbi:hypothetical protein HYPSUDRAFT_202806 [Hypholoma sublateritium FD-334 SS-4]|uniref:Uncharacterized protein n=1 Tax=Hypholoma sublateritium (strain FD-334 SS-4) TaxID=945553 RepID=A0A0D2PP92_HYPSF|nr:hypothetical protein HYPSUDRAFT_202806 [Hypholoma sublateritium FD-334 SS-4]
MSSDGFFGDDDFDAAAFEQLYAIEAAHFSPERQTASADARHPPTSPIVPAKPNLGIDSCDLSFKIEDGEFAQLATFSVDSYEGKAKPVAGPSKPARTSSNNKLQITLFGDILPAAASSSIRKPRPQIENSKRASREFPAGDAARLSGQRCSALPGCGDAACVCAHGRERVVVVRVVERGLDHLHPQLIGIQDEESMFSTYLHLLMTASEDATKYNAG